MDSLETVGRFYVVAGTYGRGLWKREISGDDPSGVVELRERLTSVQLAHPRPNPARGVASIEFALREAAVVGPEVFDVSGRKVDTLVRGLRDAGMHQIAIDVSGWAAGVYLVNLEAAGYHT